MPADVDKPSMLVTRNLLGFDVELMFSVVHEGNIIREVSFLDDTFDGNNGLRLRVTNCTGAARRVWTQRGVEDSHCLRECGANRRPTGPARTVRK